MRARGFRTRAAAQLGESVQRNRGKGGIAARRQARRHDTTRHTHTRPTQPSGVSRPRWASERFVNTRSPTRRPLLALQQTAAAAAAAVEEEEEAAAAVAAAATADTNNAVTPYFERSVLVG